MSDVARLAGVSVPTVSRVLNSPDVVRPGTRKKVEAAIEELGYRPNLAARALVTAQTKLLGVLHPQGTLFGPLSMTAVIQRISRERGYSPVLAIHEDDCENAELLEQFRAINVDGIILVEPTEALAEQARKYASMTPIVSITPDESFSKDDLMGSVVIDNVTGARDSITHMLSHGHTSIGFLLGPSHWYESRIRQYTWTRTMKEAGLNPAFCHTVGWHVAPAYERALDILQAKNRPTAILAANDDIALGVLRAAGDLGLSVPSDLALIGYDNIEFSPYFSPALTTVRQPFLEAGTAAIETLLTMMAGGRPTSSSLPTQLIIRESCGC